jgi:RNA polymerase sigma-70 factor (ECF subfamily)
MAREALTLVTGPVLADDAPTSAPPPDPHEGLARAAAGGDRRAVDALVAALAAQVFRVVRAIVGARDPDLHDLVQESLLAVVRAVPAFRFECTVSQFASRIAARSAIGARKRARSVRRWLGIHTLGEEPLRAAPDTPHDLVVSARREVLLRSLLAELPDAQSEALTLHLVVGLSIEETAATVGAPPNTVRSRLRLAREALRSKIETDPILHDLASREDAP